MGLVCLIIICYNDEVADAGSMKIALRKNNNNLVEIFSYRLYNEKSVVRNLRQ